MLDKNPNPNIIITLRTLLTGGFVLDGAQRKPGYMLFYTHRYDEFGTPQKYCFALADDRLVEAHINGAKIAANHSNAQLVIIGDADGDIPQIEWLRFINLFGGPVFSSLPIEPSFNDQLITLSFNRLPEGLEGTPDDLFEIYVQLALEFILGGRVIRYGQERRFEKRPDGLVIPNPDFTALYDAKAYQDGYKVTINTIRQFGSYVLDFKRRYRLHLQRLDTFIVVSGEFPHKQNTLGSRSRDMLSECGIPLSFLRAQDLATIIENVREHPSSRRSINWRRIFSEPIVKPKHVISEIDAILKDNVIRT